MKIFNIAETTDEPVNWKNIETKGTEDTYRRAVKQEASARHRHAVFEEKLHQYQKLVATSWQEDGFKTPVSHKIKTEFLWWGIPTGTPNADKLFQAIKFYVDRTNRARKLMGKYQRLAAKLKKVHRAETLKDLKSKSTFTHIDSADVPRRIIVSPHKYFNNPYWDRDNVVSRYAGPVVHFPKFTTAEQTTLIELERTLRKFGIPGMTKMYGSTIKKARWNDNRFVAFGADGRLIWKRMGGNTVYIDGNRVSITLLTNVIVGSTDEMAQRDALEPLKSPK